MDVKLLSSLEKVFSGDELTAKEQTSGSMLKNEIYSFQLAVKGGTEEIKASIYIDSPLAEYIKVYKVSEVPVELPCYDDQKDDYYLKTEPALYPDVLYGNNDKIFDIKQDKWSAIWFAVEGNDDLVAGEYPVKIALKNEKGVVVANTEYKIEVINKQLPKQKLIHTEWFYIEGISEFYKTQIFDERFWELLERYIKTAVKYGQNMLFTPVFTPPYYLEQGQDHPTVQLVDVFVDDSKYTFNFNKLKRWFDLAGSCGVEYFEISHLYSQGGMNYTPKIFATVNGEYKKIFDNHTIANEEKYSNFVIEFLKELTEFLKKEHIDKKCYFHVGDEPGLENLETYKAAADVMKSVLKNDYRIFDALSDYEFYLSGVVPTPVPTNNHIDRFLENKVENLWTYYCCAQGVNVSNRFMAMPSYRNRILSVQLYKFNLEGFLHWGYNYWYNYSGKIELIDPYKNTDTGKCFPSGDAFLVYPGENGPVLSIRIMVLNEALQDLRAFQLLESLTSKDEVMALVEEGLANEITFSEYPRSAEYILNMRAKVNEKINSLIK